MWVVFWLLCGIGAAMAASNKGRSGFAWFWLGVLLGPFGLLFALLAQPVSATPTASATPIDPQRACPYCAETIKAAAIVCRFCGRDVPPDPGVAQAATDDDAFEQWLAAQGRPAGTLSADERASYRQAWEYNRRSAAG